MANLTITCPHCGFSRTVPGERIPAGTVRGTCPGCRQSFTLAEAVVVTPPPLPPEPPMAAATPTPQPPRPRTLSFAFHGTANDYFGIWIVNALLKLLTCGGYTAWAKVRKRNFFYGNTTLQGEPFAYLADPMALFKGWLIGAAAFLLYMISSRLSPALSGIVGLALFLAVPWLIVRSQMFNARNSAYRNIRFSFRPDYREAYQVFAWLPLLTPFTLGLITPYLIFRQRKFLVENCAYGATPFSFDATPRDFYRLFGRIALGMLGVAVVIALLAFLLVGGQIISGGGPGAINKDKVAAFMVLPMLSMFIIYFFVMAYVQTALANLTWNAITAAGNRFKSTLRARDMVWLYLSNGLAIAATLGLLTPWATVRLARYRFARLSLFTRDGLDGLLAAAQLGEVGAAGEEIGDIFGISVDVGL